jgi:hypothetical protein
MSPMASERRSSSTPRDTPDGKQMDFVEVMEITDGLIQRHCVYWGWRGVKVIQDDAYHK